jgi:multiple antibiotic resistance protein
MHLLFYLFVMLNPVALFLYVLPLKKEVGLRHFLNIMTRASIISFLIYALFAVLGEAVFSALRIQFDSFRIFGGIVVSALALSYIMQGKKSMISTRGEFNQIASEIALPFIVGAGTITISILIGRQLGKLESVIGIAIVLMANLASVALLAFLRHKLHAKMKIVFDKNAEIMLRINGFLVGAFGIDLIVVGINNLM